MTVEPLTIDCAECAMEHTAVCADCVVTFLCDQPAGQVVRIDRTEARALRLLGDAGLVPPLRHVGRAG